MTNGSYLFLLKLFLNTNKVIYLGKEKKRPKIWSCFCTMHLFHFQIPDSIKSFQGNVMIQRASKETAAV